VLGSWKKVLAGCTETSINNYRSRLENISEELRPHLDGGGFLKSRIRKIKLLGIL
jgi:hypothetical protein